MYSIQIFNLKINADNEYISINMNLNNIDTLTILLLEFIKKTHLIKLIYNKIITIFKLMY